LRGREAQRATPEDWIVSAASVIQYGLFLLIVTLLVRPFGGYLARVFSGERTWLDPALGPLERALYRFAAIDPTVEMDWKRYTSCFLLFSSGGVLLLYLVLRMQPVLHTFDPAYRPGPVARDLAMNTAISFATTTTWQAYAGETTMTYFSQVFGLTSQNFLAGAAGLAVGVAFIRGFARQRTSLLGNFWADVTRALLWVLLPLSLALAPVLVWQGVPMNFAPYLKVPLVQAVEYAEPTKPARLTGQLIAMGPVAALQPIKNLGTNGGGFFNANGAHPYENPTPLTNFVAMLAIAVLPASLTYTFGRMTGRPRQGWVLFWVMLVLFVGGLAVGHIAEQRGHVLVDEGSITARVTTKPAATWKARRRGSASAPPSWPRSRHRTARPGPTARCTTASRRSAAWSPSSTCSSGKWSSAAWGAGSTVSC